MRISRRTVMTWGLAGAGLLSLASVGLALRPTVPVAPSAPLRALDPRSYSILHAVAERVSPGDGAFPAASAVDVAGKVDALLATMDPAVVGDLRAGLLLLDNALVGLALDGRVQTFTASSAEVQEAILEAWRTSRLYARRQIYKALRGLCASAYYASPEVWPATGYPGPPDFRGGMTP